MQQRRKMPDEHRLFYERYFVEQDFSPQEKLKQLEKVSALEHFTKKVKLQGFGLVIGVGKGADLFAATKDVVALDLPFTYLPEVKRSFPHAIVMQGDATCLPFADNSFDYVIMSEVLEHIPDRAAALGEIARVLAPDGIFIVTTPNWVSSFGLARKLIELFARKRINAGDQIIDVWVTPWGLRKEMSPFFGTFKSMGWWFFPPTEKGSFLILSSVSAIVFRFLLPIEKLLRQICPYFGHSIFFASHKATLKNGSNDE